MEVILGIDPGSHVTGWAAVGREGRRLSRLASGAIRLPARLELAARLARLQTEIEAVIAAVAPGAVVVEDIFTHRNARSALALGQARGVVLAAAARRELPVFAYPPATVKRAVCGHGRAEKPQVQRMVQVLLTLPAVTPEDESDAMAIAICHALCPRPTSRSHA
jgi:crossover junction endodeoxyribonuclease RuvC